MARWISRIVQPPTVNAVFKAKDDITNIAMDMGYKEFDIDRVQGDLETGKPLQTRIDGITGAITEGDFVVYQYPTYNGVDFERGMVSTILDRGASIVLFLHDSDYVRWGAPDDEIGIFNVASALIVHTQAMADKLREAGVESPMFINEAFDYLSEMMLNRYAHQDQYPFKRELVFAGGLNKSSFLADWQLTTKLTVFGRQEPDFPLSDNLDYQGEYQQDELLWRLPFCFGLAWDTDSPNGSKFGEYTKYNNPHKVSMYLGQGLPVIVWSQAGIAPFITKNHLGYAVDSIEQIDGLLAGLSDEEINDTLASVNQMKAAIRNGFFTRRVLTDAEAGTRYGFIQ